MTSTESRSNKKRSVPRLLPGIVGLVIIIYTLLSAGLSFVRVPPIYDEAELIAFYEGSSLYRRPYAEIHFDEVSFTGLYLYAGDENTPTDWVMYGLFRDKWLLFYQKASDPKSSPADIENVSYILRAPRASNAQQAESIYKTFTGDVTETYGLSDEMISALFYTPVLEADRNGVTVSLLCFIAGIALITVSVISSIRGKRPVAKLPAAAFMPETPDGNTDVIYDDGSDAEIQPDDDEPLA